MAETYDVTKQVESIAIGDTGAPQRVLDITYVTKPSGIVGSVQVPIADLNAERVHTIIAKDVAAREAIAAL